MGRVPLVLAASSALVTSAVAAHTWTIPPRVGPAREQGSASPINRPLVTGLRIGSLRIEFEVTRFRDIMQRRGTLKVRHFGDASEAEHWTCLTLGTGHETTQLWLSSDELMGGEVIDGAVAVGGRSWPLTECPLVDPGPGPRAFDNGLWIGSSRAAVLSRLGRPTASWPNGMTFDFEVSAHGARSGDVTAGSLAIESKAGRVTRMSATRSTSF